MKIAILAAGFGKRLEKYTKMVPKPLIKIHKRSLMERLISQLNMFNVRNEDIFIVTGYKANLIESKFPAVQTIYNNLYSEFNNFYSVFLLKDIKEELVLINGDVIVESSIIKKILTADSGKNYMMVDDNKELDEEDMKVKIDKGRILSISKELKNGDGEYIGISRFTEDFFIKYQEKALVFMEDRRTDVWYETVIDRMIKDSDSEYIFSLTTEGKEWSEIDTEEDLILAKRNKIFSESVL